MDLVMHARLVTTSAVTSESPGNHTSSNDTSLPQRSMEHNEGDEEANNLSTAVRSFQIPSMPKLPSPETKHAELELCPMIRFRHNTKTFPPPRLQ